MARRLLACLATTVVAVGVAVAAPGTSKPAQAATVPSGFDDVAVAGFSGPTAVEWLPSGQIAVLEQRGRLAVGTPGGAFATALTLEVCSSSERGLLGFTADPAFLGTGLVYVYYTRPAPGAPGGCVNRVSRFTMTGATIDPASEVVLLDGISSVNGNHNGGNLEFGPDGYLYVSVGDAGRDPRGDSGSAGANDAAQELSLLNGKILRISRDGQPAPGNPIGGPGTAACATRGNTPSTPGSWCQEIFAWGLRNPYRFAFDRNDGSGRFFVNDVGQGTREEVDEGGIGRNYGWPMREGRCPAGQSPPCAGPPAGLTDPIGDYGRDLGQFVTGGAFTPDGLWPRGYDGTYLYADGGSGTIWMRPADASVVDGTPFATGAGGIADMTFGFDAEGRLVLYYVQTGGGLRAVVPPAAPPPPAVAGLKLAPVTPLRAYDTEAGVGVAPGPVLNGTTRRVQLAAPPGARAALVNVTYAATDGPGFVRAWATRAPRPETSNVNADRPFSFVANAAIVPLDESGAFVLESATTGRVVVDVFAWLFDAGGSTADGRFVALDPARLADTRLPAGAPLASGSPNPWRRAGDVITIDATGVAGVPAGGQAAAVVVSIAAIAGDGPGGFVGAFPSGGTYGGTSNVNVLAGDVRANLAVVPLGADGAIALQTLNIADVAVDVLGWVTTGAAPVSSAGLYSAIAPTRIVDTRAGLGFGRLGALAPAAVEVPATVTGMSAVVQNVTVTRPAGPGWVAAFPDGVPVPEVSTVNVVAADQTRAALAFTSLPPSGRETFTALVPTDLVVDVTGGFSR